MPPTPWDSPWSVFAEDTVGMLMGAPGALQTEGVRHWRSALHRASGEWTLVSWWDRSGDQRGFSLSAFAINATMDAGTAEKHARAVFPRVFERMDRHLGLTPDSEAIRDRVLRALVEATQPTWDALARILNVYT